MFNGSTAVDRLEELAARLQEGRKTLGAVKDGK
jgi:hypothetical protein